MDDMAKVFEEVRASSKATYGILEDEVQRARLDAINYESSLRRVGSELRDGGITTREQRIYQIVKEALERG